MLDRIKRLLLLTEDDLNSPSVPLLRQSALRIILTSGMLLVLAIILHSSWRAYQLGFTHVIIITLSFYCLVLLALILSVRFQVLSSVILLLTVFAAGFCILFFVQERDLARLGAFFVYTTPLISLMFFPRWVTFSVIGLNFIPFLLLVSRYQPQPFLSFSISLPQTYEYLHSLLFLFFNLCIPLAILRVFSAFQRNANSLKQLNQQISRSHQLYEEMFENTSVATILVNDEGEILKLNSKACELLGLTQDTMGRLAKVLKPVVELEASQSAFWQVQHIECQRIEGAEGAVLLSHIGQTESGHLILQLEDLSELRLLHQRLEDREQERKIWQAYDLLTQLPNLLLFSRMTQRQLKQTEQGMLVIIRLCNVKYFNQQHGYNAGDELLKQFALRARENLTRSVILGRLRGVKFIAWSPVPAQAESFQAFAANLLAQLPEQLTVGQQMVRLSYELGISSTTGQELEIAHYIEQCESALEFAEHFRQPIAFYTAAAVAEREAENQLVLDLKAALQHQQLMLWLQPKVTSQGRVESFEALLRWEIEPTQFVAPDRIVALAEKYGLLVQVSRFVVNQAVRILSRWRERAVPFTLSINLAGPDIMDAIFFSEIVSLATHQPWLVEKLEIELTETSIITQQQLMFEKLTVLKKLGFRIAIDDFGTGQASLSLLAKLPASTLKLDRSFLTGFPHDRLQLKVLQATIQLARSLNLKLIIEGVETEIQRKFLLRLGSEFMQGYLFSKPHPVEYWQAHRLFAAYFSIQDAAAKAAAVSAKIASSTPRLA